MLFNEILSRTTELDVSDIHLTVGIKPKIRKDGILLDLESFEVLTAEDLFLIVENILSVTEKKELDRKGSFDIAYSLSSVGRFRVNIYTQRGSYAIASRVVTLDPPDIDTLSLPEVLKDLSNLKQGLVLVTGPTGSGKSTTLASMINYMNKTRQEHIITIEDPIEFLHKHNKCMINQREIGNDSISFLEALTSALRQDPDVIVIGEMRDLETISTALTAAETGHLVLSTLHTIGAVNTINRIIDVFPPHQQEQIKIQLSSVLQGVVSQQLIPNVADEGRSVAFEILTHTQAVSSLIQSGNSSQLKTVIQTGSSDKMISMDISLLKLYKDDKISRENLLRYAIDKKAMNKQK